MGASTFGVYPCTMFYMGVLYIHLTWASCIAYLSGRHCLSVCIYDESLKGPDDDVPVPIRKRRWVSPEHDNLLVTMLKLLLIGLVGGALFGVVMFVLSEYCW